MSCEISWDFCKSETWNENGIDNMNWNWKQNLNVPMIKNLMIQTNERSDSKCKKMKANMGRVGSSRIQNPKQSGLCCDLCCTVQIGSCATYLHCMFYTMYDITMKSSCVVTMESGPMIRLPGSQPRGWFLHFAMDTSVCLYFINRITSGTFIEEF